jgi:ribosomal protein S13
MTKAELNHKNRKEIVEAVFTPLPGSVPHGTIDDVRVDVDVRVKGLTDEELATVEQFVLRAATLAAKHAVAGVVAYRELPRP